MMYSILTQRLAALLAAIMLFLALPFTTSFSQSSSLCGEAIDIALVLDRSASMDGQKLIDAKDAASSFVGLLNPAHHQVSLVSFSSYANIETDLTTNFASAQSAINGLNAFGNTYIDEAINTAHYYLSWRGGSTMKYIVLMSDGLPSGNTEDLVRAEVTAAKASGIRFFSIGLGLDVDGELMGEIATAPSMYYHPMNSESLRSVYEHIAANLCCGNGALELNLAEDCDDGNINDGDGCNARCEFEYRDVGLRFFDGNETMEIAVLPSGEPSPLRIAKGGQVYHIALANVNSVFASKFRINTINGVMAIRRILNDEDMLEPLSL
jgi:cysteine-rich repeat protein